MIILPVILSNSAQLFKIVDIGTVNQTLPVQFGNFVLWFKARVPILTDLTIMIVETLFINCIGVRVSFST